MRNLKQEDVAILLSTYNGESFLKEQLESLYMQTYKNWILYIHDDGSKDKTLEILNEYASKYDNIKLLNFRTGCGAKDSFLEMLRMVDADYFFFCDQDDVWNNKKIELSLDKIINLELSKQQTPIIIHSDLTVVDERLNIINNSFWELMTIRPSYLTTFHKIGANCMVTGCTMCFNKYAKNVTKYPAKRAVMHDVWITLCVAKSKGMIYGIEEPLVLYRQHKNNTIGAKDKRKESQISYKIRNIRQIIKENKSNWMMLKDLNYGSFIIYIYYKLKYKLFL